MGVPQGFIVGAFLFIIYINDMPEVFRNVTINLFADDTLLYIYDQNIEEITNKMNSELKSVVDWLNVN